MMVLWRQAVLLAAAVVSEVDAFMSYDDSSNNIIRTFHYSTRNKRSWSEYAITEEEIIDSPSRVEFISPLLQDGYPQAVQSNSSQAFV